MESSGNIPFQTFLKISFYIISLASNAETKRKKQGTQDSFQRSISRFINVDVEDTVSETKKYANLFKSHANKYFQRFLKINSKSSDLLWTRKQSDRNIKHKNPFRDQFLDPVTRMEPKIEWQKQKIRKFFQRPVAKSPNLRFTLKTEATKAGYTRILSTTSKNTLGLPYPPFPAKLSTFCATERGERVRCGGWAKILKVHRVYRAGNDLRRSSASDLSKDTRNLQCIGPSLVRSLTLRFTPT